MDYSQLAQELGGTPAPAPKEPEVDYAALAKEFGGALMPAPAKGKEVDYAALAKEFGGAPLSRGTGDLLASGFKSGVTGLQSMFEGVSLLKDISTADRISQALSVYDAIDKGEITSPAQASQMGFNVTSAAKYLKASPEARLKMRENQFGSQEERKAIIGDSIRAFQQYQKEMQEQGKGVPDFTDIESLDGFRQWLSLNLPAATVQLAPVMVAAIATGGYGAFAFGAGMGIGETVGNRMQYVLDKVKNLPPEEQADKIEQYIRDTKDTTMLIGLASGALDLAGPVGAVLRGRAKKEGIKYFTKKAALKAGVKEIPRSVLEEAVTGAGQEGLQILGEKKLGEMEEDLVSKKNFKRIVDAGAVEALGGGVGGGAMAGVKVGQTALQQRQERKEAEDQALLDRQKKVNERLEKIGPRFNELVTKFVGQGLTEQQAVMQAGAVLAQEGIDLGDAIGVGADGAESVVSVPSGETAVGEPTPAPAETTAGTVAQPSADVGGVGTGAESVGLALTEEQINANYPPDVAASILARSEELIKEGATKAVALQAAEAEITEVATETEATPSATPATPVTQADFDALSPKYDELSALTDELDSALAKKYGGFPGYSGLGLIRSYKEAQDTAPEARTGAQQKLLDDPQVQEYVARTDELNAVGEQINALADRMEAENAPADEVTETEKQDKAADTGAPVVGATTTATTETGLAPAGKKRGRPKAEKTPEQVEADKERRRAAQGAGRDAIRIAERAQKVVQAPFDEGAFPDEQTLATALEARNAEIIEALTDAYRILSDPRFRKNKAGQLARTVIDNPNVSARQREIAQNRAKRKPDTTAKAEPLVESTNPNPDPALRNFTTITQALQHIARTGNPFERLLANRLLPFVKDVKLIRVRDPNVDITNKRLRKKFTGALGMYAESKTQRAIYLNDSADVDGFNNTTVLHEALHGATMSKLNAWIKDPGSVDSATRAAINDINKIMLRAAAYYGILNIRGLTDARTDALFRLDAFEDIKEFVAYGLTQPEMQDFLMQIPSSFDTGATPSRNIFTRFVDSIRKMFNIGKGETNAFLDLVMVTDQLLSSPDVVPQGVSSAPAKKLTAAQKLEEKLRKSKRFSDLNTTIPELFRQVRSFEDGKRLLASIYQAGNVSTLRTALGFYSTKGIANSLFAGGKKIANLVRINETVENLAGMRAQMIREFAEKVPAWVKFNKKNEEAGKLLGDTMHVSTLLSVDPTKHANITDALANDAELLRLEAAAQDPNLTPKQKSAANGKVTRRKRELQTVYKRWDTLGKIAGGRGQEIYRVIKQAYQDTFELHEKLLTEKIAASTVPGDIKDASTPKGKLMASITKTFQEARKLQVYFPLMRYGQYWFSVGKGASGEFYMFESATARNNAVRLRAKELGKTLEELLADETIRQGDDVRVLRNEVAESSNMLKEIFEMLDKNKLTDVDAVKDQVYQMYLMTLPEKDMRRRFTHRQGKTGFSGDVIRNFITTQHTAANQLSRLKYSDQIRNYIGAAYAELAGNPDNLKLSVIVDEVAGRALNEITPSDPSNFIDRFATLGNQIVFYWLLSSIKSAVVQMTQLPIVGLNVLASQYNPARVALVAARYGKLYNMLGTTKRDAQGNVTTKWGQPSVNDSGYVNKHPDPTYRSFLKRAWQHAHDKNMFMSTYAADMTARAKMPTERYAGPIRAGGRAVINLMGGAFHHLERISREIMYMSTFELEFEKAKADGFSDNDAYERAIRKAVELTYESLFDYTPYNKPRYFKQGLGKLSFQFATYPINVASFLLRNFYGMLPYLNRDGKREASIKFFGTLGMTGLFAGATGLPFYSLLMGFAEGIRELMRPEVDEDDEEDEIDAAMAYDMDAEGNPLGKRSLDLWFRGWFLPHFFGEGSSIATTFGLNKEQAHLLQRSMEIGPISALTDVDISGSTSMAELGDALWVLSAAKNGVQYFMNPTGSAKDKIAEAAFEEMSGPFGGLVTQGLGGFDDLRKGDVLRGLEKLMPGFFKGTVQATRYAKEGFKTPSGEEIMEPEYYTTGKLLAQTLGFGSAEVNAVQKSNFLAKQVDVKLRAQKKDLLDQLAIAVRQDKDQRIEDVLLKIFRFNVKNVQYEIDGDDIEKSLSTRESRALKSYQGVSGGEDTENALFPLIERTRTPRYQ